jgi:alkanesulfonate monooxygenase SsuD/methylene tetrahydromethanopterin reductase-like flavin-dependent oxidoreductase (luciferase family)
MRFGSFFYPTSFDPSEDSQAIDDCLHEAALIEELGMDAIWLAEHHFAGEVAYADPLVFASAVAAKTNRVLIGLGVVEMALHNPVRLAIQTALVDNLSHGRLIVGTGRGSNYGAYEYIGFGTTMSEGHERLDEAEDLLIKAWTEENLHYEGKFWKASFPSIRPRPYQQPHPPLARACINDESIKAMAGIGRPALLRGSSTDALGRSISLYRDTMISEGFSEPEVEQALDNSWVWRECYIAETDDQALEEFLPPTMRASELLRGMRERWNPKDQEAPTPAPLLPRSAYKAVPDPSANEALIGSPKRVAEQVALLRDAGTRNFMLSHRGLVSREKAHSSWKLLCEKVMPLFK